MLLSIMWFFLFFIWIMLLLQVFGDIFRSDDLGGVAKAVWVVFVIITPYLGVFVYLIVRGSSMAERQTRGMQAQENAAREYIREAAGTTGVSAADELERLVALKAQGAIGDAEFDLLKAKIVA